MPFPAAHAFLVPDPNLKKQAAYNSGKMTGKILFQKKHFVEALYDLGFGDLATIHENFKNCKTPEEINKALADFLIYTGQASSATADDAYALQALFTSGMTAAEKIAEYEEKLKKPFSEIVNLTPPEIKQIKKLKKLAERPKRFRGTLKLRGPKPSQTQFDLVNKPAIEGQGDYFNFKRM